MPTVKLNPAGCWGAGDDSESDDDQDRQAAGELHHGFSVECKYWILKPLNLSRSTI